MKKALLFAATLFASAAAFAQEAAATATTHAANSNSGLVAIGAAIAIGLAVYGGTSAQGKAASAALEGIARNPGASGQIFTPMLLGVAFVETLLIFTLFLSGIAA